MSQYDTLRQQAKKIEIANFEIKDPNISLFLDMLQTTERRIEKLKEEKTISTPGNRVYLNAYAFYVVAATIRMNLINGQYQGSYGIPGFPAWEDIDNIFEGFAKQVKVIVFSNKDNQKDQTGDYLITEKELKVYFANSDAELEKIKSENSIVLNIIELDHGRFF